MEISDSMVGILVGAIIGGIGQVYVHHRNVLKAVALIDSTEDEIRSLINTEPSGIDYDAFRAGELQARAIAGLIEENVSFIHQYAPIDLLKRFERLRRLVYQVRDSSIRIIEEMHENAHPFGGVPSVQTSLMYRGVGKRYDGLNKDLPRKKIGWFKILRFTLVGR